MFGFFKDAKAGVADIDEQAAIAAARYVVIDTELTGLDEKKDSIVSVGAVRMTGGRIHLGDTFYRLVNPGDKLTAESIVIHEIMPSEVASKPGIEAVLQEFRDYCGGDILVGHFMAIDAAFLNREMKRVYGRQMQNPLVDTLSVHAWLRKRLGHQRCFSDGAMACSLFDIARCFSIPVEGAHNALRDAFATAQLFQRFLGLLEGAGIRTVEDLLQTGIPFEGGDCYGQRGEISNL